MVTVADLPRTTQVYRDVFGFTIDGEKKSFLPDKPTRLLDESAAGRIPLGPRQGARLAAVVRVRRVQRRRSHAAVDEDPGPRRDAAAVPDPEHRRRGGPRQACRPQDRHGRRRGHADSAQLQGRADRRPEQLLRVAVRALRRLRPAGSAGVAASAAPAVRRPAPPPAHAAGTALQGGLARAARTPASAPTRTSASSRASSPTRISRPGSTAPTPR